jgi:type IV secretory pathway ATPase VirB11/archaellum biosynthesis ATPase
VSIRGLKFPPRNGIPSYWSTEQEKAEFIFSPVRLTMSEPVSWLEFFDSEDAPFFFGRAKAAENALEVLWQQAVKRRPFVLVLGPGASGKTSLVRADILPALTQVRTVERD